MPDESEPSAAAAGHLAANAFALWLAGGTAPGTIDVPAPVAESAGSQPTGSPPGDGDALMPAVPCGTDLQDAQDLVQETGVFLSQSEDATGEGRMQVIDSNWTVVAQRPEPGTPIAEGDAVFLVVPDDEFEGC
jgi:hypothetical protein